MCVCGLVILISKPESLYCHSIRKSDVFGLRARLTTKACINGIYQLRLGLGKMSGLGITSVPKIKGSQYKFLFWVEIQTCVCDFSNCSLKLLS